MKSFLLVFCLLILSTNASAYKLYKTSSGKNVRWATSHVEIVLDGSLLALAAKEDVEAVIREAFELWELDATLPISFELIWDSCNEVADDGNNCIFACEDKSKCYDRPDEKGGTTFLNISPSRGTITDVDIVLNADDWEWDVNGNRENGLNFARVLSHEIGHLLGIDHSEEPRAIMYPSLSVSDKSIPSLHDDDVDAAETLYEGFVETSPGDISACSVSNVGAVDSRRAGIFGLLISMLAVLGIRRPKR
jgi:hypothetical protein